MSIREIARIDNATAVVLNVEVVDDDWLERNPAPAGQTFYPYVTGEIDIAPGYTYDVLNRRFIAPQPFPSWTLDPEGKWQPPVPLPEHGLDDTHTVLWDEDTSAWQVVPIEGGE